MSYIDLIILSIFGFNIFQGVRRGLISIVMDSLAIILSVFIAINFYPNLAIYLQEQFSLTVKLSEGLAFVGFWLVFFIGISMLGRLLNSVFSGSIFGPINWVGGAVAGFVKGLFFIVFLAVPLLIFELNLEDKSVILNFLKPYIEQGIKDYIPVDTLSS